MTTRRITKDAVLLALLCVIGMLSIPMGDNIKVSFQLLVLFIIFGITDGLADKIIIPALYLLIGLLIPIYAGFMSGITPTFGFVIGFVISAIPFHFIYKYLNINIYIKYIIACLSSLIVIYLSGTIFMMNYLSFDLVKTLLISVVPYIGFDIAKIAICVLVMKLLPNNIKSTSPENSCDQ